MYSTGRVLKRNIEGGKKKKQELAKELKLCQNLVSMATIFIVINLQFFVLYD